MKNILKTLILTSLVLFAGTTLILSCSHDAGGLADHPASGPNKYNPAGGGDGSNPFVGDWSGTAILSGQSNPATFNITETNWVFKVPATPEYNAEGTYTYPGSGNSVKISDSSSGTAGTAMVSGNTLIIKITDGPVAGGSGTFTKGTSSSNSGDKPAYLSSGATQAEALAKVNEIIAYPGTPNSVIMGCEILKQTIPNYSAVWSQMGPTTIASINAYIDQIP
jgi:hypothetical protein